MATLPASLMLVTVIVNDSVSVPPSPSVTVTTTAVVPTCASTGVPVMVAAPLDPALIDNQELELAQSTPPAVQVMVIVPEFGLPSSASVAATVYEYAESSVALVPPELVMTGSSAWSEIHVYVFETALLFPGASVNLFAAIEIV